VSRTAEHREALALAAKLDVAPIMAPDALARAYRNLARLDEESGDADEAARCRARAALFALVVPPRVAATEPGAARASLVTSAAFAVLGPILVVAGFGGGYLAGKVEGELLSRVHHILLVPFAFAGVVGLLMTVAGALDVVLGPLGLVGRGVCAEWVRREIEKTPAVRRLVGEA
jgi:hypothetical protein